MSYAFHQFTDFKLQLGKGVHHLHAAGDTLKVFLTNEQPLVTDTVKGDMVEIASTDNGYASGGADSQNDYSLDSGVGKMTCQDVTWTQSGANPIGPFQWAVLYNDTASGDPLIGWWEYPSTVTVVNGETFKWDVGADVYEIGA